MSRRMSEFQPNDSEASGVFIKINLHSIGAKGEIIVSVSNIKFSKLFSGIVEQDFCFRLSLRIS